MKNMCFQFYMANVTVFQKLSFSLTLPLSSPFHPKIFFHSNPNVFKLVFYFFNFKVCFLKHSLHFCVGLCSNLVRVLKFWGFFEKGLGFLFLWKKLSKFWLGWVSFTVFVSVLAPWGILLMYWGIFHHVHALFNCVVHVLMQVSVAGGAWGVPRGCVVRA